MKREEIMKEDLMAILPKYIDNRGNCTIIYTKSAEKIILEKTLKSVIKELCKYYLLDLKEVKNSFGELISSKNFFPIPFTEEDIFIPIKTRIPILKYDGAIGYINIKYIEKIIDVDKESMVYLHNNIKIKGLSSANTIKKHLNNGQIVKKLYQDRKKIYVKETNSFYDELDKPATKGDIAFLRQEIMGRLKTIDN